MGHCLFYNREEAEGERGPHSSARSNSSRYKSHQGEGEKLKNRASKYREDVVRTEKGKSFKSLFE